MASRSAFTKPANGLRPLISLRIPLAGCQFLLARSTRRTAMRSLNEYRILVTGLIAVQLESARPREAHVA
jgi:hypothetical protein